MCEILCSIRTRSVSDVEIRPAKLADADACGRIIHAALGALNQRHGYQSRWPTPRFAAHFATNFIANPGIWAIVAEADVGLVGCNLLDERSSIGGIGPTAGAPSAQRTGIGRALMEDVMIRREGPVRLLQDSFNTPHWRFTRHWALR